MTETKPRLVWIDDEPPMLRPWRKLLQGQIDIEMVGAPEDALARVMSGPLADAYIIDAMMPTPPGASTAETRLDLHTGLVYARRLRARSPAAAILLLTNANPVPQDPTLDWAGRKIDTTAAELLEQVLGALERRRSG